MKRYLAAARRRLLGGEAARADAVRRTDLLGLVATQLAVPRPAVAILGTAEADGVATLVRRTVPQAVVHVLDPAVGESELHLRLAAVAPLDLLVVTPGPPEAERAELARATFFHVREGGAVLLPEVVAQAAEGEQADGEADESGGEVAALVAAAFDASLRVPPPPSPGPDDRGAWGRAVESATARDGHVALTNGLPARAKVREEEVGRFLDLTGDRFGRVLLERPGAVLENPAPIRQSEADGAPRMHTRFEAPPLQLRAYDDVTCLPGQVVLKHNVLLPETFRHLRRPRLGNRFIEEAAPRFGRIKNRARPEPLAGTYFHLDSEYRGHFGHAMTEQISRLWAWEEAKRRHPDLKALLLVNRKRTVVYDWEYRLYEAAGIARDDLVLATGPVRVERLLAATPMFSQPEYVHPDIAAIYRRIGDDLAAEAPDRDYPARIFCSRRLDKRACRNTDEVEAFFAERGFEIVYPEDYPLGEQVQMFRSAQDVAGFGGSAMFTLAFVPEPKRVVLVSSENYWAWNEYLMAAVWGHQVNVAWCRPERLRSLGFRGEAAMQSPYTFDPGREGRFLREVLGG